MSRALILAIATVAACAQSNTIQCDDGRTCPVGTICAGRFCATQEQIDACATASELASCSVGGIAGFCQDTACIAASCGDGIVIEPEECDGNALPITDCFDLGYHDHAPLGCSQSCLYDTSACRRQCGDDIKDPEEQCDAPLGTAVSTCAMLGFYEGTAVTCSGSCTFDVTGCDRRCGDGVRDPEELCDGVAPPGTCLGFGYAAGRLGCSPSCGPGFADCRNIGWPRVLPANGDWWDEVWGAPTGELFIGGGGSELVVVKNGAITKTSPGLSSVGGIWGTSASNLYAVDKSYGEIVRFDGMTWTTVSPASNDYGLHGIHGTAANDVWAVGWEPDQGDRIFHYDGNTWTLDRTGSGQLYGVWTSAPGEVWAVGNAPTLGAVILRRTPTGWITEHNVTGTYAFESIWGTGPNDIYAVGYTGALYHRDANGWTQIVTGVSHNLHSVWGRASDDVYVVGDTYSGDDAGSMVLHFDGTTWWRIDAGTTRRLEAVGGTADLIVTTSPSDLAIRHAGASWAPMTGTYHRVSAANDGTLFAALASSPTSTIWRRTLTGWTAVPALTGVLSVIWAHSSTSVFAATSDKLHRLDGGSWTPIATTTATIRGLWGTSATDLWAPLHDGRIGRWNGAIWSEASTGAGFVPLAIDGSSASNVFVVGDSVIRHFNGSMWSDMPHPSVSGRLIDVSVVAPNDVWVVGDQGAILHYDGVSWSLVDAGTTADLYAVDASGPNDVWAVGTLGTLLHFDGVAWSPVRARTGSALIYDVAVRGRVVLMLSGMGEMVGLVREADW